MLEKIPIKVYYKKTTGRERYGIIGNRINKKTAQKIIKSFKGLDRYGCCNVKALIAAQQLGYNQITYGELTISDKDKGIFLYHNANNIQNGDYHAWIEDNDGNIFDFALPGIIRHAKMNGYFKKQRPSILAGKPPNWLKYKATTQRNVKDSKIIENKIGKTSLKHKITKEKDYE